MGQQKKYQNKEAMGKSRGGLSTKIHAAIDGLGNPVRFLLTAGQCSEMTQSDALIEGFSADYVIDELIGVIESTQTTAVIPPTLAPSTSAKAGGISITPVPQRDNKQHLSQACNVRPRQSRQRQ